MCLASCVSEELEVQETTGEEVWCTLDFSDKNFEPVQISTKATLDITHEASSHNM